jgi:hypothetical protein
MPGQQGHHIDWLIDLHPGKYRRPDDNPGDDLHDGAWQLHALHARGKNGRGDRDHADNQQPTEAHCAHGPHALRSRSIALLLSPAAFRSSARSKRLAGTGTPETGAQLPRVGPDAGRLAMSGRRETVGVWRC